MINLRMLFLVLAISCMLSAQSDQSGTTAANFIKLGSGAKAQALAESYVAVADDPSGMLYNPAGLAGLPGGVVQFSHNEWFQGLRSEHFALGLPLHGLGTWGINLNYLVLPEQIVTQRTANTDNPYDNYSRTGSFTTRDLYGSLGWAERFWGAFLFGAGFKLVGQQINDVMGMGYGLDIGGLYETPMRGLDLGVAVQNLGLPMRLSDEGFSLPLVTRIGASYHFLGERLQASLEGDFSNDAQTVLAGALEYDLAHALFPRLGYRNDGIFNPWSAGLGVRLYKVRLDLATMPYGELGQTYRGSLSYQFSDRQALKPVLTPLPSPGAQLVVTHPVFSNKVPGSRAVFSAQVNHAAQVKSWGMAIYGYQASKAQLIKSMQKLGDVPDTLEWDGKDAAGMNAPEGYYQVALWVAYHTGQKANSKYVRCELSNQFPELKASLTQHSLDAANPGKLIMPAQFEVLASSSRIPCRWRLEIFWDQAGNKVRTMEGELQPQQRVVWDGKGEQGDAFISNTKYRFRWILLDALRNVVKVYPDIVSGECVFERFKVLAPDEAPGIRSGNLLGVMP
jgi:hypothetical protein